MVGVMLKGKSYHNAACGARKADALQSDFLGAASNGGLAAGHDFVERFLSSISAAGRVSLR